MMRTVAGTSARRVFSVVAASALLAGCRAQDSQGPGRDPGLVSLGPGQSAPVVGATTLRIEGGGEGSEHVLVLADTGTTGVSAQAAYQVTATGVGAAGAVSAPATTRLPESANGAARPMGPTLDFSFGARLNRASHARLRPGFRTARSALGSRSTARGGASRSVSPAIPRLGDLIAVNVGSRACDSVVTRWARVAALGTKSIVLADTLNPSGGFTTADYQRFAARFDTLVYPLNVAAFGAPADIDLNERILLLFTTAVNELTPRNSDSYVGGFFFDRDLFPILSTPDFAGCEGSNASELFYLLAPDPTGLVNGNVRRTGFVDSVTTSVLAHEFQHLINSSRRLYVTQGAEDFEETWLNEGLSHIAEELLFYHEADLPPRQNLDAPRIRNDPEVRSAYNADMSSNTARYRLYLAKPSESSPLSDDDSLETRGATWNFLRYLADRKAGSGGSDASTWQALVNSRTTGLTNLRAVFGQDIGGMLRDWSISHYADDLSSSVIPEHSQPSWNFHSIYPALQGAANTYPLQVKELTAGSAAGTLTGGAAAYYRFSIPANGTATVNVTTPGPIQAVVVRVR